jgi:hypothetical protein
VPAAKHALFAKKAAYDCGRLGTWHGLPPTSLLCRAVRPDEVFAVMSVPAVMEKISSFFTIRDEEDEFAFR